MEKRFLLPVSRVADKFQYSREDRYASTKDDA
jgi:hypothetical protein